MDITIEERKRRNISAECERLKIVSMRTRVDEMKRYRLHPV